MYGVEVGAARVRGLSWELQPTVYGTDTHVTSTPATVLPLHTHLSAHLEMVMKETYSILLRLAERNTMVSR